MWRPLVAQVTSPLSGRAMSWNNGALERARLCSTERALNSTMLSEGGQGETNEKKGCIASLKRWRGKASYQLGTYPDHLLLVVLCSTKLL